MTAKAGVTAATRARTPTSPPALPGGPFASSDAARRRMQSQRRADTAPELALRRAAHRLGLRYFVHRRPLPALRRSADLVFPTARVAVFVDGCFWHGCDDHGRRTIRENTWYWPEKIASNRRRDDDTDARLRDAGWMPVRVWEHEEPAVAAARLARIVEERRALARG
ncbi:MAG TPA: DNA mismatch endonuclease Vsr [Acidimicrobiales bacterium]